jgi:acyl transferase domain-containing protein
MTALGQHYEDLLLDIDFFQQSTNLSLLSLPITMISSVTGHSLDVSKIRSTNYWCQNLESPVFFNDAVQFMMNEHEYHLIEIGPHSALELPIIDIRNKLGLHLNQMSYLSTLVRYKNSLKSILHLIARLYLNGRDVPFEKINDTYDTPHSTSVRGCEVLYDLPTYV